MAYTLIDIIKMYRKERDWPFKRAYDQARLDLGWTQNDDGTWIEPKEITISLDTTT